eukprot:SAG11_NODE_2016_length_3919_cov_4.215445_5_plen_161_part_00
MLVPLSASPCFAMHAPASVSAHTLAGGHAATGAAALDFRYRRITGDASSSSSVSVAALTSSCTAMQRLWSALQACRLRPTQSGAILRVGSEPIPVLSAPRAISSAGTSASGALRLVAMSSQRNNRILRSAWGSIFSASARIAGSSKICSTVSLKERQRRH